LLGRRIARSELAESIQDLEPISLNNKQTESETNQLLSHRKDRTNQQNNNYFNFNRKTIANQIPARKKTYNPNSNYPKGGKKMRQRIRQNSNGKKGKNVNDKMFRYI